jgi:hypothetical protein
VDLGDKASIIVGFAGTPTALQTGDKINLISTQDAGENIIGSLDDGTGTDKTTAQSTFGETFYTFDIALEDPNTPGGTDYRLLTATWTGQGPVNQDKAEAYLDFTQWVNRVQ